MRSPVIHATTNEDGDDFEEWTENICPAHATVSRAISRLHATKVSAYTRRSRGRACRCQNCTKR